MPDNSTMYREGKGSAGGKPFADTYSPLGRDPADQPRVGDADGGNGSWQDVSPRSINGAPEQQYISGVDRVHDTQAREYLLPDADGNMVAFDNHHWRGDPPREYFTEVKGNDEWMKAEWLEREFRHWIENEFAKQAAALEHAGTTGYVHEIVFTQKSVMDQFDAFLSPTDYIMLVWAGRPETPEEVAGRIWSTMRVLEDSVPNDDPRYRDLTWVATPWSGMAEDNPSLYELPAARTLQEIRTEVEQRSAVGPDGTLTDGLPIGADLARGGLSGEGIGSYEGRVGSGRPPLGNKTTIRFKPIFPTGDKEEMTALFRHFVRIWQPDWARLDTLQTSREVQGPEKTYADYLIWLSQAEFGAAPALETATTERYGDGTLITVREWSIDGVRALHKELLSTGVPTAKLERPLEPQEVPQFS